CALEGGEAGRPEDLVHPGAPDAGDGALVAQQGMKVTGLVEQGRELLQRGWWKGVRAERGHGLVVAHLIGGQHLGPRALLCSELPQPELTVAGEAEEQPRAAVAQGRTLVVE